MRLTSALGQMEGLLEVATGNPVPPGSYPEPKRLNDNFDKLIEQFKAKPRYFLRVRGDSMDPIGFRSDDGLSWCTSTRR